MSSQDQVAIFWDFENCHASFSVSGFDLARTISEFASSFGSVRLFKSYAETTTLAPTTRSELQSSGVTLIDCPRNGRKNVADQMMIVDMITHGLDNGGSSITFVVITGDRDFAYALSVLRQRRHKIILVSPSTMTHVSLSSQASEWHDWNATVISRLASSSTPRSTPTPPRCITPPHHAPPKSKQRQELLSSLKTISRWKASCLPDNSFGTWPKSPLSTQEHSLHDTSSALTSVTQSSTPATSVLEVKDEVCTSDSDLCDTWCELDPPDPSSLHSEDDGPKYTPTSSIAERCSSPPPTHPDQRFSLLVERLTTARLHGITQVPLSELKKQMAAVDPTWQLKLGFLTFRDLIVQADVAGVVITGKSGLVNWVALSTPGVERQAPSPPVPEWMPLDDNDESSNGVDRRFAPLVQVLARRRLAGERMSMSSAVAGELGPRFKLFYKSLGFVKFLQYVEAASASGLVHHGGHGGNEWLSLEPECTSSKTN